MSEIKNRESQAIENDEIDLGKLFGVILDAKWFIISLTMIFSVLGVVYALLSTPIYKADALIQVEEKSSGMSALVGDMGDMFSQDSSSSSEIEIIKSRMILSQTVDKFNLTIIATPNYMPVVGKGLARLLDEKSKITITKFETPVDALSSSIKLNVDNVEKGTYSIFDAEDNKIASGVVGELLMKKGYSLFVQSIDIKSESEFNVNRIPKLAATMALNDSLTISERGTLSGMLELSMEGKDPTLIQKLLNDISKNYFLQNVNRNSAEAKQSLIFLQEHLPEVKMKLNKSEDKLNDFRQKNHSVNLGKEAESHLDVMVNLESQLNELTFKESEISQRFTKEHPAYKALLENRKTLLNEKAKLSKQVKKLPKTQRAILRMRRDVEVNQQIYIQILNNVQELSVLKAGTVGNVRILDDAQAYPAAIAPKKSLIVVLATLLGGMFSVFIVLVKVFAHKGLENPEEIEALGLPVYASIPKSDWQNKLDLKFKNKKKRKITELTEVLLAEANPADLSIEAFRGLRTSLHFAMMEAKNNVVMISGASPSIGKTFVSCNFAAVIAKTGQKVLVVDADMRKGYLQKLFCLPLENGLSDMLSGQLELSEVIKKTKIDNLDVITRGQVPPNPSELLMHARFSDFIDWASKKYDLIIVDTPPVLAVTDPSIVGGFAGTTLMVARFDRSTVKELDVAMKRFEMAGIEVKGCILNAVERKASSSYGYGYYNYAYESDKA